MAEVTEEDLEKKRASVDKLREQIADAQSSREERERNLSNEIAMKQLDAEEARLKAELAATREAAKASNVKAGTADLIETLGDDEKRANEQAKAVETAKSAGKE